MSLPDPIKVGVTGGIGSGKSTVCRLFGMLGIPVYDCDLRARQIMEEDPALISGIKEVFGAAAYIAGKPDRGYLAGVVFNDRKSLAILNSLVHPAVIEDFHRWVNVQSESQPPYVIMESAIIFESGLRSELDRVITVTAPESLRIERTVRRDGVSSESVQARISNQMDDSARRSLSDYVLTNDDNSSVWEQVLMLDSVFRKMSGKGDGFKR